MQSYRDVVVVTVSRAKLCRRCGVAAWRTCRRRGRAAVAQPGPAPRDVIGTRALAESWWRARGAWAFDTVNGNSWETTHGRILSRTGAGVVFTQETKLLGDARLAAARAEALLRSKGRVTSSLQVHC